MNQLVTCADDFGLSRGISDSILETVDRGAVRTISLLANGTAVEYALAEYAKRSERVTLALHVNLTEGKAISATKDIPHLVDEDGNFRYSIARLWLAYIFASYIERKALCEEVSREIAAQAARMRPALGSTGLVVNGHQHVQMIPFVFDAILNTEGVSAVRVIREPFYFCGMPSFRNMLALFVLARLSRRAAEKARARGIRTNDWFIGLLYSGRMNERVARAGLSKIGEGSVELLFHPGSATKGELIEWGGGNADLAWHYSPWRFRERASLLRIKKELE